MFLKNVISLIPCVRENILANNCHEHHAGHVAKTKTIQISWNINNSPIKSELGTERRNKLQERKNELGLKTIKDGVEID